MVFANVRELKARASEFIRKARESGGVVVVSRGKPTAALIPLDEDSFEDYLLEHHAGIRKAIEKAFDDYRRDGGVRIERLIEHAKREVERGG